MKIALVSPYDYAYPGGVSVHISHLQHELSKLGHEATVIAPVSTSKASRRYQNTIAAGRPVPVPSSGSIARIAISPWLPLQVKAILKRNDFDIVHVHEPLCPVLPLAVLHYSRSVNIGTFHAYHESGRSYLLFRRLLMHWFRKLHSRIAVSRPAQDFISRYFPAEYRIIPNGIDVDHFAADVPPVEAFNDGKINILFVGRLEKRKGLDHLLRAFSLVKKERSDSRLIVVGPGTRLRRSYQQFIDRAGLEDVVFAGYVPYSELPRYYRTADICCAPATGKESFGIVLLEGMAAGKPVVASSIEGYSSVVDHGVQGLLVPPKDHYSLAQALQELLGDEAKRQEMGLRGKTKAQAYGWEHVARNVMDCYLEALAKSRP
ncbi:MAG: glycosyltransferase family 4 protein [Chloroflexi bacterium]|nr:glycosyltransferase family 4 protein [Chloroflexota bacterium]